MSADQTRETDETRVARRRLVATLLVGFVFLPVSGALSWVLLLGALGGNLWALAGLVFGVTTSAVAVALVSGSAPP